jgi:hypothetical protein
MALGLFVTVTALRRQQESKGGGEARRWNQVVVVVSSQMLNRTPTLHYINLFPLLKLTQAPTLLENLDSNFIKKLNMVKVEIYISGPGVGWWWWRDCTFTTAERLYKVSFFWFFIKIIRLNLNHQMFFYTWHSSM